MKTSLLFLFALVTTSVCLAQNEKYIKAMEEKVVLLDSNHSAADWKDLANGFERIADAEKSQWMPYYYSAFCNIMAGYRSIPEGGNFSDNSSIIDPFADKAEELTNKAEALSKDNPEISILWKMVHGIRMMGNPMARYMTEAPLGNEALEKAKSLNPNIPRIYILEGEDKFYTPEQFGGSKEEAKILFDKAQALFATFQPESSIAPNWGRSTVLHFLSQYK